ncbi:MAG: hypothetical protein KF908_05320 [Nitrosomonas sp.]|nr:hypothetical protein [Nitrosomonas sp.]
MIITESEKGFGLPDEKIMPNGLQLPVDMRSQNEREVIEYPDECFHDFSSVGDGLM